MDYRKLVDRLGLLQAAQARLDSKAKKIKDALIAEGYGSYEGDFYRAVVFPQHRESLDRDAVKLAIKRAKFSPQYIAAHTLVSDTNVVKVVGKIDDQTKKAA
jgi:hypothetical protein